MIWKAALATAAASGSKAAHPMIPLPGRTTISAPTKPPNTRTHRKRETRSLSTSQAISVATTGVSITIAVNSATGMRRKAAKAIDEANASSAPRAIWNMGLAVLNERRVDSATHRVMMTACRP